MVSTYSKCINRAPLSLQKPRPTNTSSYVRVISSKEFYKVTKQIHEEELHHAGYKKLIDFVCMIKSIAQFNCKILTACWGQSTYIF